MVAILFVKSISGAVQCTLRSQGIAITLRPHKMLTQLLVYPKEKSEGKDTAGVVYSIPCKDCPMVYIGGNGKEI